MHACRLRTPHAITALIAAFFAQTISAGTSAEPSPAKNTNAAATASPDFKDGPVWRDLSPSEKTALAPLQANWDSFGSAQKRKWQTVAKDFAKLPADKQQTMHTRMAEWSALSPQQRNNARINFAQSREVTDGLTADQRKVQWQAYQNLSPQTKRELAEQAPSTQPGAALAVHPQPVLKKERPHDFGSAKSLAKSQALKELPASDKKITVAPYVANQGSILPPAAPATIPPHPRQP